MTFDHIKAIKPVLIAGPTASGKSKLALQIAKQMDGVIVNADASQIYDCWRIVTAGPTKDDEANVPHRLFGHVSWKEAYSVGHWLNDVSHLIGNKKPLIIVGGTGLYFYALTEGLNAIPPIPIHVRARASMRTIEQLKDEIDRDTLQKLDPMNRVRLQRAWEVLTATGRSLTEWQTDKAIPLLPLCSVTPLVLEAPCDWLEKQIADRFSAMIEMGVLDEVSAMKPFYNPQLPAFKAIGVSEFIAVIDGMMDLETARKAVLQATRRFAKRQRTWFRKRMSHWQSVDATSLEPLKHDPYADALQSLVKR